MKPPASDKVIKYLLVLQILIVIGVGICEVLQLAEAEEADKLQNEHLKDWNQLIGYTSDAYVMVTRIYYWIVILISIGMLGWLFDSSEKRWKNIQEHDNINSKHLILFVLWFIAITPSIIILSKNGIKICSPASYSYALTPVLIRHCNAYLSSVLLAYTFVFTIIIQLLLHFIVVKRQNQLVNPPLERSKITRVRRSKRVSKKRSSVRSSAAFSNGTRLSIVVEDEEERSVKSSKSVRSPTSNRNSVDNESEITQDNYSEYSNEKQIYSNV